MALEHMASKKKKVDKQSGCVVKLHNMNNLGKKTMTTIPNFINY